MPIPRLSLLVGYSLLLSSCSQTSSETPAATAAVPTTTSTNAELAYTVLDVQRSPANDKITLNILLPERMDTKQLGQLGQQIKASYRGYTKTWIFYYLKGMKVGSGAWATTHFLPELEVRILGATQNQQQAATHAAEAVVGNVVGRWYEEQYTHSSFVIYQKGKSYQLKTTYDTGQQSEEVLLRKGNTFTYKEQGTNGEYLKLLPDGRLGFFNREGKQFTVATSIEAK